MCRKLPCFFVPFVISFILFLLGYIGVVPYLFLVLSLLVIVIGVIVWVNEFSVLAMRQPDLKDQVSAENARFAYVLSVFSYVASVMCLADVIDKTYGSPFGLASLSNEISVELVGTLSIMFFLVFIQGIISCKKVYRKLQS